MLNFSIAYGKTAMGLSKDWKVRLVSFCMSVCARSDSHILVGRGWPFCFANGFRNIGFMLVLLCSYELIFFLTACMYFENSLACSSTS
jgi:hypothetical protein